MTIIFIANFFILLFSYTLLCVYFPERTVSFDVTECQQNKFFCNKIWQVSKYVLLMTSDDPIKIPKTYTVIDQWILSRLSWMVETVNYELDQQNFYKAVTAIKEFIYYEFCDYYVVCTLIFNSIAVKLKKKMFIFY